MGDVEQCVCLQCNLALPYSEKSRRSLNFRLLNCKCNIVFRKAFGHYEILMCTGSNELFENLDVKATTYIQHPNTLDLLAGQEVTLSSNKVTLWVEKVNKFRENAPLLSETDELKIVIILSGIPVTTSGLSTDGASSLQVLNLRDREADDVQHLVEIFSTLLHDTKWADVQIQCRHGETLRAHSCMLALRSPYFDENLKNKGHVIDGCTKVYKLEVDVDQETMKKVLKNIYLSETPPFDVELACSMYLAAERFALEGLKNKCWEYMLSSVTSENFIECLKAAHRCQCDAFKEAVISFIMHHREVLEGDRWMSFIDPNNVFIQVLQRIATSPSRQRTPS